MSSLQNPTKLTSGRNYESDDYLLPADSEEKARLDLLHRVLFKAFDNRLTVAPVHLKDGDRVLESGAGTGTWLQEFSAQIPRTVTFDGIDISSRMFPSEFPNNIRFSVHSITQLPKDWDNTFAFVHQRFLVLGLTESMWNTAVSEMFRVLVPCGWVELVEIEMNMSGLKGTQSIAYNEMKKKLLQAKGLLGDVAKHLPSFLQDAGFVNVHAVHKRDPIGRLAGQDGLDRNKVLFSGLNAFKGPLLSIGGLDFVSSEDEYDVKMAGLEREWLEMDNSYMSFVSVYAQKPTS